MGKKNTGTPLVVVEIIRIVGISILAVIIAYAVAIRTVHLSGVQETVGSWNSLSSRIDALEQTRETTATLSAYPSLYGKTIVYDGDSIAESRQNNGGGYPALIADITGGNFVNLAKGGARLCSYPGKHSVVDNLVNLPNDGDLYCFEGGINDFWSNTPLGECKPGDYTGPLDTGTICGAMETIFRYCMENYPGKPVCFVIVHKIQQTATAPNANGDTFEDYRNAMVQVCQKYSIPYYDAFEESGLNGWNSTQSNLFLTSGSTEKADGIHPNEEGYKRYYVPQLLSLFQSIVPVD